MAADCCGAGEKPALPASCRSASPLQPRLSEEPSALFWVQITILRAESSLPVSVAGELKRAEPLTKPAGQGSGQRAGAANPTWSLSAGVSSRGSCPRVTARVPALAPSRCPSPAWGDGVNFGWEWGGGCCGGAGVLRAPAEVLRAASLGGAVPCRAPWPGLGVLQRAASQKFRSACLRTSIKGKCLYSPLLGIGLHWSPVVFNLSGLVTC